MSDMGDLIAVGLLDQPNGLGLTANQAHEIGERVASRVAPLDAAWQEAEAALPEGWEHLAVHRARDYGDDPWCYIGEAGRHDDEIGNEGWSGPQPTPAAALRALAAKLREVGR